MSSVAAELQAAVVEIGGLPIRIASETPFFVQMVRERYAGYLSSETTSGIDLTVELTVPGRITAEEDVSVKRESAKWRMERADFRLDWDPESRRGILRQPSNPYSLDTAIRVLHTLVLASQGGFLLHAASAVRNGKAFLFFGPSGAGKTTMVRAAPADAILLTDEISYVRQLGDGYTAYGTPF